MLPHSGPLDFPVNPNVVPTDNRSMSTYAVVDRRTDETRKCPELLGEQEGWRELHPTSPLQYLPRVRQ